MAVKFGVFVPQGWKMDLVGIADPVEQYEAMTRAAQAADERRVRLDLGLRSLSYRARADAGDHLRVPGRSPPGWCATPSASHVGQMVTCNGYRNPALLAKIASTVDVMSHGRLICGLGAGWYEHEWRAYGYGFPEAPPRMGMFREACEIITRCGPRTRRSSMASITPSTADQRAEGRQQAAPVVLDRRRGRAR